VHGRALRAVDLVGLSEEGGCQCSNDDPEASASMKAPASYLPKPKPAGSGGSTVVKIATEALVPGFNVKARDPGPDVAAEVVHEVDSNQTIRETTRDELAAINLRKLGSELPIIGLGVSEPIPDSAAWSEKRSVREVAEFGYAALTILLGEGAGGNGGAGGGGG